ncbi:hypothetical protein AVEN_166128-1, partial [Araneus ventricosus]
KESIFVIDMTRIGAPL